MNEVKMIMKEFQYKRTPPVHHVRPAGLRAQVVKGFRQHRHPGEGWQRLTCEADGSDGWASAGDTMTVVEGGG